MILGSEQMLIWTFHHAGYQLGYHAVVFFVWLSSLGLIVATVMVVHTFFLKAFSSSLNTSVRVAWWHQQHDTWVYSLYSIICTKYYSTFLYLCNTICTIATYPHKRFVSYHTITYAHFFVHIHTHNQCFQLGEVK